MRLRPGQAVVIVLMALAVVLTVSMSVISQSVSDIEVSEREEQTSRAFNAAETGIERALITDLSQPVESGSIGSANYQVVRSTLGANSTAFLFPNPISAGEVATLFMVGHEANGSIDMDCSLGGCYAETGVQVCWGDSGSSEIPALEGTVVYKPALGNSVRVARFAVDPSVTRRATNMFTAPSAANCSASIDGSTLTYGHQVNFYAGGLNIPALSRILMARFKLHYNTTAHQVGTIASGVGRFPSQGLTVASVGSYGDSTQKIEVKQLYPDAPSIFDYSLYSGSGGIVK